MREKIAEKLLKKKIDKETEGFIDKQPDGKDSEEESEGGFKKRTKDRWQRFKNKFSRSKSSSKNSKKKRKKKSDDEDSEETEEEDDEEAMDRLGLKEAAPDSNFGKTRFEDTDRKATWNVLVRVIEGKDLPPGALRVRAILDGRQKATRTCTEGVPRWRQNLCFTFKNITLEKIAAEPLTLNVTSVGRIREKVGATFCVLMSAVLHSKDRAVVSKWIALHSPDDDEDDDGSGENCGFLKVSLCIYGSSDGPPHLNDDLHSDEVWSGAQLEDHTLRIRLFRVHHLAEELIDRVQKNKKKKPFHLIVRVHLGHLVMESGGREMQPYSTSLITADAVCVDQELYLPIQWPTVIQKVRFVLILKQGSRKRVLGQASIPLRFLYEPGENGFMPTFGPAFVNFYGHETMQRLKWRNEKNPIDELKGSKYLARLLCSLDSVDYNGESVMIAEMGHNPLAQSKMFEDAHRYSLFCSFTAANMINPLFASRPVSFHVSMGEHGSPAYSAHDYRASTFAAMPDTDKHKYFFMPWGNHRPLAEVACIWEDVDRRMARHNAINQMVAMLTELTKEATRGGGMAGETASLCLEALDNAEELLDRLARIPAPGQMTTELDRKWEETRKKTIMEMADGLDGLRWETAETPELVAEKTVRMLARLKETMVRLAEEVQISLPAIIIKMLAGEQVVGYAKINPSDVFYHDNDALTGEWCGRVRAINLKWPTLVNRKNRKEEFPGVVHVRMWFGRRNDVFQWMDMLLPAEIKSFLEVYVHQKKSKLNRQWKAWKGPQFSDEHGATDMQTTVRRETFGFNHMGNWVSRTSHDMWICKNLDRPTFVERVYEVQKRGKDDWIFHCYTDFYGGEIDGSMKSAPKGWEWTEKWAQDKHTNHGDRHGWVYALHEQFWGEAGTVDKEERAAHQFRRRCIARTRRQIEYNREFEELEKYEQRLADEKWEFAADFKAAWHSTDVADAAVRRRRFLVEVEREKDLPKGREHENFFLPRLFEVHNVTTTWQLRCYILWAKDLLPIVKNSAHAFVRVTFLTRAQQSIVVANSQNPIWCETLICDRMPIPGGKRQIVVNPPTIIVEVRGERSDDSEMFLGRFEAQPTVVCSPSDQRVQPQWHQLCFPKGKTRGAVLAAFELFHITPGVDNLPLEPMKKQRVPDRFEVPGELKPKFERYALQFLCWGVRNLSTYQLLSVKKPFVEMLVGDHEIRSDAIENAAKNPNFPNPIINVDEVELPSALELSPPMVINLHDRRAFRRHPIVGVAHITDFTKHIFDRKIKKAPRSIQGKEEFDKLVERENESQSKIRVIPSIQKDGEPPIDWWSKYYSSQGMNGKAPGFEECGMERISVFKEELEKVNGYNDFSDFLDTFTLYKCSKGNFDDPEEKEKMGELKGKLFITRIGKEKPELPDPPGVEFVGTTRCLLRVYVVEARGLVSTRRSGLCDPYIVVRCGKQKINLKKSYRPDTLEPVFGELIEMEVTIPIEKDLTVTVMDRRRILTDDEIGSTKIDMENRLLTKWRGTVGISRQYTVHGELAWRDQVSPLTALQRYCAKMMIPPPELLRKGNDRGLKILGVEMWYSDVQQVWKKDDEKYADMERRRAGADEENSEKEQKKESVISKEPGKDEVDGGDKKSPFAFGGGWGDAEESRGKATLDKNNEDSKKTPEEILKIRRKERERLVGRPLQCVALHIMNMMNLVPEHVETRTLRSPLGQNVTCGELRMFVDMFPMSVGSIPAPLDISPRQPDKYQLRVAVLSVSDAIPVKRSFGTPVADLYVKVFINGTQKPDRTDIHYRSMDGVAEFNWRFLINVDYNPWENKVVAYRKTRLFRKPREELVEPLLIVQLWDKNKFKKDTLLGEMVYDIRSFSEGLTEPEDIAKYTRRRRLRQCCCGCCSLSKRCCLLRCFFFCKDTWCCLKIRKNRKNPMPKAPLYEQPENEEFVSMFETGAIRGWWPMLNNDIKDEQKEDLDAKKKKDDDYDPDALYVMGLVEMEMQLLPLDEAEADPVGKKRKDPNHSPHLDKPKRSKWNRFWCTSRIKPCVCWCWHKWGMQALFWTIVILLLCLTIWAIWENWPFIVEWVVKAILA